MLPPEYEERLRHLVEVFLEENRMVNLSAFRTPEHCWIGNVLDALAFLDVPSSLFSPSRIVDVGTGGGFPLLPLSICLPSVQYLGFDATKKKIDAIGRIVQSLGLANVELRIGRAEELGHDSDLRERYDIVTVRAVAPLNVLLEYASPLVRPGGHVVAWKSLAIEQELQESQRAQGLLSCPLVSQHRYVLPGDFGERQLLIFEKTAPLLSSYPRTVGVPAKHPIQ